MKLRSLLFVPGDRPERMVKALNSGADALILDLEDAVAPSAKAVARREIEIFLQDVQPGTVKRFVRINALDAGCLEDDLKVACNADGIVLPKAEGLASLDVLDKALGDSEVQVLPITCETPGALFQLSEFVSAPARLCGLTWGAEDLSAALGAQGRDAEGKYSVPFQMARSMVLFAAHAAKTLAIETVYPRIHDVEGLERCAAQARADGFTGMMAIHPKQIPVINSAFTPSAEEIAHAQAVVDAFAKAPDAGVINLDGKMIDAPHLILARLTLAMAET